MFLKSLNVMKEMVNVQLATIELWMHLGGLPSTQEARIALSYLKRTWFIRNYPLFSEFYARLRFCTFAFQFEIR